MSMQLVFILIVFSVAFISFFLQEILGTIKRVFEIPGLKLLIPLAFLSYLVEVSDYFVSFILAYYQLVLVNLQLLIAYLFPFKLGVFFLSRIILLTLIYCIPFLLASWYKKRHPSSEVLQIWDRMGAGVWLVSVILILMA